MVVLADWGTDMANGWAKLGEALAGVSPAQRAKIEQDTYNALATRDVNTSRAKQAIMKTRELEGLGEHYRALGIDNPDAAAGVSRSGVNLGNLTRGLGDIQEQGFRQAAVNSAAGGNYGGANAQLMGVANGPVALPQVVGGIKLGNRFVEGGGEMVVTPVGAAQIGADNARGRAAIIRAERPPASRATGGKSGAAPKLSAIDNLRMKDALAAIDEEDPDFLEKREAVYQRFEGGGMGSRLAPEASTREPAMDGPTWYQDPETGQQRKVASPERRDAYKSAFRVADSLKAEAQAAIAAGADPEKVRIRLREEILRRTKGK